MWLVTNYWKHIESSISQAITQTNPVDFEQR